MLHISGVVKGTKTVERVNRDTGVVTEKHYVGFANMKTNGYDGEEIVQEVQVSEKLLKTGLLAHYEKLKGAHVMAPVFPSAYSGKNGAVINYFFADDGKPKAFPASKASA